LQAVRLFRPAVMGRVLRRNGWLPLRACLPADNRC
jgi:hypothetical protein